LYQEGVHDQQLRGSCRKSRVLDQFVASPYWAESLVQLAGFLVNVNPDRPAAYTTFTMDSFDSLVFSSRRYPG